MTVSTVPDPAATPSVPPPVKVPFRWRNLFTLTGSTAVDSTEGSVISTIFPTIASALGLNSGHLGTMTAVGKLASAPAGPAWTWLAARTSRKTVLVVTSLLGGAFGVAAGFSQGFWSLLILNTLMAASLVGGSPIGNALIMDSFDDRQRAKAISYFYGAVNAVTSFIGPVLGLFTRSEDGWRLGLMAMGGIAILAGVVQWILIRDPGVGASEPELAGLSRENPRRPSLRDVLGLFRVPTFSVMMASRLLSGHLLVNVFGVTFLVSERGFDNATAAIVLAPFGVGYIVGTLGGGQLLGLVEKVAPDRGRVAYIQAAQVFFAVVAFFGTQFGYDSIAVYGVFWALMGAGQGMNPPVNRPIVSAVVLPELRGQAFAIFITVFETIGWALFSLGAGALAVSLGIQQVFLGVLVVLMLVNAALLTVLYRTYPRDVRRVKEVLAARRATALDG